MKALLCVSDNSRVFTARYELNKHNLNKFQGYTKYNESSIVCFR